MVMFLQKLWWLAVILVTMLSYFAAHHWLDQNERLGGVVSQKSETETPRCRSVNMTHALRCLGKPVNVTTAAIHYPSDPYDHFMELQQALQPWTNIKPHKAPGYQGPWIENHWQRHFGRLAGTLHNHNFCTVFGPYIPLLPAWTDIWKAGGYDDPAFLQTLQHVLRGDVLYVTVVQNDDGFPGNHRPFERLMRRHNMVVLSAGGYGHVPIPLLKQPERPLRKPPVADRRHLVSYTGSLNHAPRDMRRDMLSVIGEQHYHHGRRWRNLMRDSKFQLCPRGFGRTSYHVMETFQMGLIPVQVYLDGDIPWMPYETLLRNVSFWTDLKGLPALLEHLETIGDDRIAQTERSIEELTPRYFTYAGVLHQIERFLHDPSSGALECRPLPGHPGTGRSKYFSKAL
jgi:hypothetical protein